jgi:hypothetical protein
LKAAPTGHRISVAECRGLVDRLLSSNQLRRSERQREFLSYVCRVALEEPAREIREVEIGCNVFGRPANYDTSQDNIVRVNASELRRRLEDYFRTDGASEPVVVAISRGSYRPEFAIRTAEPAAPPPVVEPVTARPGRLWGRLAWVLLGAMAAFLVTQLRQGPPVASAAHPAVTGFWSRMFVQGRPTAPLTQKVTSSS